MRRAVLWATVGVAVVASSVAAEVEPLSRALSASASASGPPGIDTDQDVANSGAVFGSVGLSAHASSYGPVPDFPEFTDGTDAQASQSVGSDPFFSFGRLLAADLPGESCGRSGRQACRTACVLDENSAGSTKTNKWI